MIPVVPILRKFILAIKKPMIVVATAILAIYSGLSRCPAIIVSVIPTSGIEILDRIMGVAIRHICLFKSKVLIYLFRRHGITEAKPASRAGALYYWYLMAIGSVGLAWAAYLFRDSNPSWVLWIPSLLAVGVIVRIVFLHLHGKDDNSARRPKRDGMFWPDQIFRDMANYSGPVILSTTMIIILGKQRFFIMICTD